MIEFDCPHCGGQLKQKETFAGRDGWCRICKGIILIPRPGQTASELKLSLEQRYERLDRLFKHAVTIVDEYRQLQTRLQGDQIDLAEEIALRSEAQRTAKDQNTQLAKLSTLHRSAQEACEQLRGQVAKLESDGAALREQVTAESAERSSLEETLAEVQPAAERVPELENTLADAQNEVGRREQENDELLERVLDLELKLDTAAEMATQAVDERTSERDTYEQRLNGLGDELCAAEEDAAGMRERLDAVANVESRLQAKLVDANESAAVERDRLEGDVERLTSLHEAEVSLRTEASDELAKALPLADRVPVLEDDLATARAEIQAGEDRHQVLVRQAADSECALELAEKRASDARGAWETQRQQLLDETETFRAGQRSAEEETASVRARGREAAAELQSQLDTLQGDLLNEARLRIASEESDQRRQRCTNEANAERDDALSRRDQLSRQLETALKDLESARGEVSTLRTSALELDSVEQALKQRLMDAHAERDSVIAIREQLAGKFDDVSGSLESTKQVSVQLRARITELENDIAASDAEKVIAAEQPNDLELEALYGEVAQLRAKVAELEETLEASNEAKTCLEQRLVGAENHAAFSELEGIGYRSKFSTMAKQFYEQEVARQTDAQDASQRDIDDRCVNNGDKVSVLDAVSHLRR